MKIILSRKGFDSGSGGRASPILPDGTMVSLPIPSDSGNYTYEELSIPGNNNTLSYAEILRCLNPKKAYNKCHLDPDIRSGLRKTSSDWAEAFGQIGAAQTHLDTHGIKEGDLFIFFGWFKKTEYHNGHLRYIRGAENIHAIYGYLQVGKILKNTNVKVLDWHPHSDDAHIYDKNGAITNNTIYVASKHLSVDGFSSKMPGAGTLMFSENRVLTAEGKSRSRWKLNDVFTNVNLSHHNNNCIKNDYFQSRCRGQEFVFDEDPRVIEWAKSIIIDS